MGMHLEFFVCVCYGCVVLLYDLLVSWSCYCAFTVSLERELCLSKDNNTWPCILSHYSIDDIDLAQKIRQ